jgi:hypothetical protein
MNRRRLNSVVLLVFASALLHAQPVLKLVDPLEPLFPDSNMVDSYNNVYEADFPSGTEADVHLLLDVQAGEHLAFSARVNGIPLSVSCWSQLIDVPVEQNTGLDSRTEMYTNERNPYVIRRAPFRIYEAIQPLSAARVRAEHRYTALRLAVPPSELPTPGRVRIDIVVEGDGWKQVGTFVAVIHRARVPQLKESTFFYTNWFSMVQMEEKHNLVRWSDGWYAMLDRYARMMAHGRQNCIMIPAELIAVTGGRISLDEEKMDRFIEVFRRYGFTWFESPHLMYRGDSDDWSDPDLKVLLTKRPYSMPEARRDVDTITTLIRNFTKKYGLVHSWLQHISDEPTGIQATCYRDVVRQVRSIYPEIQIMEATSDRDTLAGAIDVWCPTIDDFQSHESFFRGREKHNERILVYTCLIPGGKWLNRLLDQERLRQVYFGWGAAFYNTSGFLHWGLNQYQVEDPFTQSVVRHPSPAATPNNYLPAGDSHILYPGSDGPLSSTRFEAHRIGIEDFELFQMLKQADRQKAAAVIAPVFRSYTDYSTDVKVYRAARRELLEKL